MHSQDHPRGCGEHMVWALLMFSGSGSSPRMRGAPGSDRHQDMTDGIIPADAGSTSEWRITACATWDHPRGCGEHSVSHTVADWRGGSSPRMRGARPTPTESPPMTRIIPADAGSTRKRAATTQTTKDHPRGCGEHRFSNTSSAHIQGSSPRMRGARFGPDPRSRRTGIIPADAGSTLLSMRPADKPVDHPRGCGEHRGNLGGRYR